MYMWHKVGLTSLFDPVYPPAMFFELKILVIGHRLATAQLRKGPTLCIVTKRRNTFDCNFSLTLLDSFQNLSSNFDKLRPNVTLVKPVTIEF
ncbi:hypothetical protein Slip_1359 [Syntrophothermus lipocalidus DSM 12680]|uniref:Uncharacterized protein n=1 Tax=Syntrophothermus lipocalidus (strain DSM 12680 / TGB-C1) TaxID=643648 RepID=D7CN37_SYNLT|nr:hypothetical protein Slip_1359 [Syntrophothermus lipocalidus DSM 12680]